MGVCILFRERRSAAHYVGVYITSFISFIILVIRWQSKGIMPNRLYVIPVTSILTNTFVYFN